jgi:cobalt-zinc-cadmium efflux system outer membrane protein
VDLTAPLERDVVVAAAVARSPALAVMAHRARALVHAGRAEGSLRPAELGFEAWNLPLARPYALGEADMYMVELRQGFPAAGSLDARARAMAEDAQAMVAELSTEERIVVERAAKAFADHVQAFAEQRLQERQLALLSRMGQAVRARYTTGGAGLADSARIDVEVAKTQRALARVAGDIARSRATLNAVLRRPPGAPLGAPREVPPETVRLTVEELIARAEANRGATLAADARARAAGARREAAEAEARVPEFMVGLGYWQDPTMRPGVGVTASMSLPWLWGPGRDRVRQAEEEEAAERAERARAGQDARGEVSEAHARLKALEAELSVIRRQVLPATQRSMEALTAAFTTGNASLLDWVDVARSLLDLELEVIVLHGDLQRGIAELERAVSTALPRTPLPEESTP